MKPLSKEFRLLLLLSRTEFTEGVEQSAQEINADFDWTYLVQTAYLHGVSGLLCSGLLQLNKEIVPKEIINAAHKHLVSQGECNQALANQLTNILQALQSSGIPAIPFKGPTLADTAYGDLALRSFRDLDFLIHPEDIKPCLEKLRELEYHQNVHLSPKQMDSFLHYSGQDILYGEGVPIEPHWLFAPHTWALNIDYAGLWTRAERRTFNNRKILSFSIEDELMILCIHGSKENWSKLKWVADVAAFIDASPDLEWFQLIERSEQQGVGRMVRLGLSLARVMLNAQLPHQVILWLEKDRVVNNICKYTMDTFFNVDNRSQSIYALSLYHWKMKERTIDRFRYLLRTITQPREHHFLAIGLPDSFFFLYTPYKVLHDYLALPIWKLLKKRTPNRIKTENNDTESTDATR